jgi:hypothetical protein
VLSIKANVTDSEALEDLRNSKASNMNKNSSNGNIGVIYGNRMFYDSKCMVRIVIIADASPAVFHCVGMGEVSV